MNSNQWKKYKLEEVSEIIGGGTPSTTNPDFWGEEIPWITPRDLASTDERFISCGERCITKKGLQNSSARLLPAGTVLLTTRAPIGYLRIALNPICTNQGFKSLIPKADVVDNQFLFYLLKNNVEYLKSVGVGTTFAEISGSTLRQIEFPFPPLPVQRRIADILSALDDKIELNRQTNATLEAIAQAIFKEWFVDFNFPGATGELVESELGMIPKGWRVGNIEDFGDIVCGKTPSKTNENFFGGNIPFIKIPDMHNSVYIVETSDTLTYEGAMSQKNKFLPPNSIIVSCIATIGLVSLTAEISQTNQQINAIIPKRDNLTQYIYFTARNLKNQLIEMGSGGSTTLNVNTANFSNIKCVIPSEFTLSSFDFLVKPLFEKILANQKEILTIAQCRDSLLPKLMNGEIEV
ncbi:MAG TPA: restriction endonuclease subunit S [Flexilinea sp.]|nr:restriction endonuclease subunit S [Flexilinea sp.]HPR70884.1 restriction endonuclease subunit S [Flexilinea sp.]